MTTRDSLFSRTLSWLRRDNDANLVSALPDLLVNLEARIAREVVHSSMYVTTTLSITGRSGVLPTDCLELVSLTKQAGAASRQMNSVTSEVLREGPHWDGTGEPCQFAIENRNVVIAPAAGSTTPTVFDIVYRARYPALTTPTSTNYLLLNHFDLYLHGLLYEACRYNRDREGASEHNAEYVDRRRTLEAQDTDYLSSGSRNRQTGRSFKV